MRFDVAFDGGLFEVVQLLFGVTVGGEDARQFGGKFACGGDEVALAARQCRFPGGAGARDAVAQADVFEQAGDDVVGEGTVAADFAVVQRHLGVAGQVFAQVFDFGLQFVGKQRVYGEAVRLCGLFGVVVQAQADVAVFNGQRGVAGDAVCQGFLRGQFVPLPVGYRRVVGMAALAAAAELRGGAVAVFGL